MVFLSVLDELGLFSINVLAAIVASTTSKKKKKRRLHYYTDMDLSTNVIRDASLSLFNWIEQAFMIHTRKQR
jgi:hypothetical protein